MKTKNLARWCSLLLLTITGGVAMAIEEPSYEILSIQAPFEVRHYRPMLIAQVTVEGDMDEASSKGFRQIAGFIFGGNQPIGSGTLSSMLSPQDAQSASPASIPKSEPLDAKGVKIAMTAPVTIVPQEADKGLLSAQLWRVNFVMPSQYTLRTIPQPKNPAISLQEVPDKYYAVMTYSGFNFQTKVEQHMAQTLQWATSKGYNVLSSPQLARYDPPWTLPMFRRNEILVEISKP
jgi:hypothetical protein